MNKTNTMMSIFNITEERYKLLFGYENQYGIFHPKSDIQDYLNSHMYNLVYVSKYNSDTPSDVLKDISFLIRAGKFILHVNDIISIKMNGFTSSYRFCGILQKENDFILVSNFLKKEKDFYVKKIHKMNMVLNVPDGLNACEYYNNQMIQEESKQNPTDTDLNESSIIISNRHRGK